MRINLTKDDNNIIIKHLYEWNKKVPINEKMAMDSYIESIDFIEDDIIFNSIRINPILDEDHDITKDTVGGQKGKIGDRNSISINDFSKPYRDIFLGTIREIKINKLLKYLSYE
jgi:hypothetical protein